MAYRYITIDLGDKGTEQKKTIANCFSIIDDGTDYYHYALWSDISDN